MCCPDVWKINGSHTVAKRDGGCSASGAREAAEYCARIQEDMTKLAGRIDALKGYAVKRVTLKVCH